MTHTLGSFLLRIAAKLKNRGIHSDHFDCSVPFVLAYINRFAFEFCVPFRRIYTVAQPLRRQSEFRTYTVFASISTIQVYQFLGWKLEEDNETKKLIAKAKSMLEVSTLKSFSDIFYSKRSPLIRYFRVVISIRRRNCMVELCSRLRMNTMSTIFILSNNNSVS